jgi:hypothetical protein
MSTTPWPAFAGIDWGGEHHQLCVVDDAGKRLAQLRVTHDVAGLKALQAELTRFSNRMPIAIERSEGLLVEHLQALGHALFAVSPKGSLLEPASDTRSPQSRTTASTLSFWPTRCATSTGTGGG